MIKQTQLILSVVGKAIPHMLPDENGGRVIKDQDLMCVVGRILEMPHALRLPPNSLVS